ncbi:MAG: hypothetical protein ABL998_10985, partial [Planctomycetota bacterium]
YLPHVEELRLAGEREHVRHDVELVRGLAIPFRVLDENGKRVTRLDEERHYEVELALTRTGRPVSDYRERFSRTRELGDVSWANDERLEGLAPGFSGLLRLAVVPPIEVHACFEGLVLDSARIDGAMDELVLHVDRAKLDAGLGTVRCRFVDAVSGSALTDGHAGVDWGNRFSQGSVPLDQDGRVELTRVPSGVQWLRFTQGDHEDFTRAIMIPAGGVLELDDVRVWPRARVRGRLIGADGEPANGTVHWVCEDGTVGSADLRGRSLYTTDGGRFDLERVARTRIRLLARIADHAPAAFLVDASSGDVEGLELRFEAGVPVKLRGAGGRALTLLDAAGMPWIPLASDQFRLPPGHHTIELGSGADVRRVELEVGSEPLVIDLAEGS